MAHHSFTTHPLILRRLEVLRVHDVTPRMRRVTLGGPELAEFERDGLRHGAFHTPVFDDHVKAIFASPEELPAVLPVQLAQGIEWTAAPARIARDYTPRRVDIEAGEMDLDFVLHGHGPASDWARGATPGDVLWVVGPKSSLVLPTDLDWMVLAGDETALPAIGRFLDERPFAGPVHIVVTVSASSAQQPLAVSSGDTIEWVLASPTDGATLESAVRTAVPREGVGFVWAAAESRALLPVRRFLRREHRLPKERMSITGYWHGDQASTDAHPPVPSPIAWLCVRAALRCGLLDDVADHPGATELDLQERIGIAPPALAALLPVLEHHGMIERAGVGPAQRGQLRIGPAGEALLADEHTREAFDGHDGDLVHALGELAGALTSDETAWQRTHGTSLAAQFETDSERFAAQCDEAESLRFGLAALLEDPVSREASRALLAGPGSAVVATMAKAAGRSPQLAFWGGPAERRAIEASASRLAFANTAAAETDSDVDVVVLANALQYRTDAEAEQLLRSLVPRAASIVVIDPARPDSLDSLAHEGVVRAVAANGVGLRGAEELAGLAARVGWVRERTIPMGWGVDATLLRPASDQHGESRWG